jgi:Flp pilus assembly pilin Flp
MTQFLKRLWLQQEAQSLAEFALLLFLISLIVVTAMGGLGSRITKAYSGASTHVVAATSHSGSLAGGLLGYGTNTPSDPKDDHRPKPDH